tara:strand:+ start:351 stop:884 length:534 start_codon:yes stop_codon:yes gene_type:complete
MALTKLNSASVIDRLPVGSVLQTKQTVQNLFLDMVCSGSNLTDISGFSVSITPTSTSSKILITYSINVGYYANWNGIGFVLCKGSTPITDAVGNTSGRGNRHPVTTSGGGVNTFHMTNETFSFLDSPTTTSATTYSVKIRDFNGDGGKAYLNGSVTTNDSTNLPRGSSTITVQEIKG